MGEDNLCENNERYQLNWAGKSAAYRALQSPTFNTLTPCQAESVDFDTTQNVFIEAENMQALKILQKSYAGKIKMIYIDPPYNTGNDSFIYPDKFSETRDEYARRVGDKDTDGYLTKDGAFQGAWRKNSKDSGHYHSNWLSMMLPRLHLAKTLLRDDGVIFISIDDNEQAQLKLLCDEVFGAENFVGQWQWFKSSTPPNLSKKIKKNLEYILCYQRGFNQDKFKGLLKVSSSDDPLTKPNNSIKKLHFKSGELLISLPDGVVKSGIYGTDKYPNELLNDLIVENKTNKNDVIFRNRFIWLQNKLEEEIRNNTVIRLSKNLVLSYKKSDYDEEVPPNLIDKSHGVDTTEYAGNKLNELFDGKTIFDYPKPTSLISYLMNFCLGKNDLIMDFFSGSGTTAHAVMQLNAEDGGNRKFICVQLPELTDEKSEAFKAGYTTIAEIAKERIRRAGKHISGSLKDSQTVDTGFKVFKLAESHFKQWQNPQNRDTGSLTEQLSLFQDVVREHATTEHMAYEIALRLGFTLTDPMTVSGSLIWLNNEQNTRKTALLLESYDTEMLPEILSANPVKVFALDKIFAGDDALKTNLALQLKDANIAFETL